MPRYSGEGGILSAFRGRGPPSWESEAASENSNPPRARRTAHIVTGEFESESSTGSAALTPWRRRSSKARTSLATAGSALVCSHDGPRSARTPAGEPARPVGDAPHSARTGRTSKTMPGIKRQIGFDERAMDAAKSKDDPAADPPALVSRGQFEAVNGVKDAFRKWDLNGNGVITKDELGKLMKELGMSDRGDADVLITEIDTNLDGVIQYDEFLDWVLKPCSHVDVVHGDVVRFDLESALRPLFQVYDDNNNGTISLSEFQQVQDTLLGSLDESSDRKERAPLADLMGCAARRSFAAADCNGDGSITFKEFMKWQENAMVFAGLSHESIVAKVQQLSTMLQTRRVLHLANSGRRNSCTSNVDHVNAELADKIADTTHQLYRRLGRRQHTINLIDALPTPSRSMSSSGLKELHLRAQAPTSSRISIDARVELCLPDSTAADSDDTCWLAKVQQHTTTGYGRCSEDNFFYVFHNGSWTLQADDSEFTEAVKRLPTEIRVYYLLWTFADMRDSAIPWAVMSTALKEAVRLSWMMSEEQLEFELALEEMVRSLLNLEKGLPADYSCAGVESEATALMGGLEMSPAHVMMALSDMKLVEPQPLLWSSEHEGGDASDPVWKHDLRPDLLRRRCGCAC